MSRDLLNEKTSTLTNLQATCIFHLFCLQVLQVFAITFEISGGVSSQLFWGETLTYKPWIGNCLLKLESYSKRSHIARLPLRSYQLSRSPRRAPDVKYDHTASNGGLWPLSFQRSSQQLGAVKEMHVLDNSQTLNPLIWWHQLYLGGVFGWV